MTASDEFDYGDARPTGAMARRAMWFGLAVFFLAIGGTALVDLAFPSEGVQVRGAERREQQRLDASAKLWDGTLAERVEYHHRDRSRVRAWVMPRLAFLRFRFLDEATDSVVVGRDHWLFLRSRAELKPEWSDEFLARSSVATVVALDRRMTAHGVELTYLPIPRKSTVAGSKLPRGYDARPGFDDVVVEHLLDTGVRTVDLREAYRTDDPEEYYYRLDTHWTSDAALIASVEAARTAGLLVPPDQRMGELSLDIAQVPGGAGLQLLRTIGIDPHEVDLTPLDLRPVRVVRVLFDEETAKVLRDEMQTAPVALAGTSFSFQGRITRSLMHLTGGPVHNGEYPAGEYMETVARVLRRYGSSEEMRHLIWESPIAPMVAVYNRLGAYFSDPVGATFAMWPSKGAIPLLDLNANWLAVPLGEELVVRGNRMKWIALPSGLLSHSGDGVVTLELAGTVRGGGAELLLVTSQSRYVTRVEEGPFRLSLPVLAEGATSVGPHVFLTHSPRVDVSGLDAPREFHLKGVRGGGNIVLDLGGVQGGSIERVRFEWDGPEVPLRSVAVVGTE